MQDGERIKAEVWNTLRGNSDYFGHLPEHLSRWVFSDKYVRSNSKQSRWISEFKERASSKKLVEEILVTKIAISDSKNPALIEELNKQLSQLQKQCTFYSEAITLDNVHALGFDYIVNQYKSNTPYEFLTSLWNMDIKKAEGSLFYPLFSEYIQGYDASDNNRIDELIEKNGHDEYLANRSSRLDTDIIKNEPLKLLLDFGGTYNWAVVAQKQYNVVKALKNFWVEKPEKVPHLIEKVCKYYSSHGKKVIELYYDAGANKENAMEVKTDIQRIKNQLNKLGWSVFDKWENRKDYIRHKLKYEFWNYVLDESNKRDDRFPKFRVNRANCHELIWSMSLAKLKRGENQSVTDPYQKDKRNETNPDYPQWQATHLSDCIDWLAVDYLNQLKEKGNRYAVPLLR